MIQIISLIDKHTKNERLDFPNRFVVENALNEYSDVLRRSMVQEFKAVFPKLGDFFDRLAFKKTVIQQTDLRNLIRNFTEEKAQVDDYITQLYKTGFLGYFDTRESGAGSRTKKSEVVIKYSYDTGSENSFRLASHLTIHKGFHRTLHLNYD